MRSFLGHCKKDEKVLDVDGLVGAVLHLLQCNERWPLGAAHAVKAAEISREDHGKMTKQVACLSTIIVRWRRAVTESRTAGGK